MKTETNNAVKHTQGPWKFHIGRGIDPRFHVQTEGGYQIAETPKNGLACGIKEVNEANARLIAAAPELLEACKAALAQIKQDNEERGVEPGLTEIQVRNAIAKATGETL